MRMAAAVRTTSPIPTSSSSGCSRSSTGPVLAGLKVHLSEFGANAATPGAQAAVANAIAYMDANADVIIGWAWWAYGPPSWWGGYHFTLCPTANYTVDDPKMAWLEPHFEGPSAPTIRPTAVTVKAPGDSTYTSKKTVADGDFPGVPAGTYSLKVAARTTYSDEGMFCVNVILENPSDKVDIDWEQMTIDLRGHTLQNSWNGTIAGTTGIVTVTPTADTTTVRARNKTSFGFCVLRNTVSRVEGELPGAGQDVAVVSALCAGPIRPLDSGNAPESCESPPASRHPVRTVQRRCLP